MCLVIFCIRSDSLTSQCPLTLTPFVSINSSSSISFLVSVDSPANCFISPIVSKVTIVLGNTQPLPSFIPSVAIDSIKSSNAMSFLGVENAVAARNAGSFTSPSINSLTPFSISCLLLRYDRSKAPKFPSLLLSRL